MADGNGNWIVFWDSPCCENQYYGPDDEIAAVRLAYCEVELEDGAETAMQFSPALPAPLFSVVSGRLFHLKADQGFGAAKCLGTYDGVPAADDRPDPASGDGYYYVARGLNGVCASAGYGDSSLDPDPRDELDLSDPCP
jgi:hypothetical protein